MLPQFRKMQCILQIANKTQDQAFMMPGCFLLNRFIATAFLLCSLLLFGSCKETVTLFGLLDPDRSFTDMTERDKMRPDHDPARYALTITQRGNCVYLSPPCTDYQRRLHSNLAVSNRQVCD